MPQRFPTDIDPGQSGDGSPPTIAEDAAAISLEKLFADDASLQGYRLLAVVGKGGMGTVAAARELETGRVVALKVVPAAPEDQFSLETLGRDPKKRKTRFETEVQATARLEHNNIIPIYSVGRGTGFAYYTMRLVDGISLREVIVGLARLRRKQPETPLHRGQLEMMLEDICRENSHTEYGHDSGGQVDTVTMTNEPDSVSTPGDRESSEALLINEPTRIRVDKGSSLQRSNSSVPSRPYLKVVTRRGNPPLDASLYQYFALRIAEIADALQFASESGVVHRDIKPGNILVSRKGTFYLADFGLAKIHEPTDEHSTACVGTPGYMPPERLHGETSSDPRSDIFALGLVLQQLMTLSVSSPLRKTDKDDPSSESSSLENIPRALQRIVHAATDEDIDKRYETPASFAEDLRRFARGEQVLAGASSRFGSVMAGLRPKLLRSGTVLVAAAVVIFVLSAAFFEISHQNRERVEAEELAKANLSLFLDSLDQMYLDASDTLVRNSRVRGPHRPLTLARRERLMDGLAISHKLAEQNPNDAAARLRIAQTTRRVAFVFQASGHDGDAARLFRDAEALLETLDPDSAEVALELSWIAYHRASKEHRRDGFRSAAPRYEKVLTHAAPRLDSAPAELKAALHEVVGLTCLAQEKFAEAVRHLEKSGTGELSSTSRGIALATAYRMVDRYEDALHLVRRAVDTNPRDSESWRNLGAIYMHLGYVDEGRTSFEKCIELDPRNELAQQGLAWACYRSDDLPQALVHIEEAVNLRPTNDIILAARSEFLAADGQFEASLRDLRKAIDLRPESDYVAGRLVTALLFYPTADESTREEAKLVLKQGARRRPSDHRRTLGAMVHYADGDYDQAIEVLQSLNDVRGKRPGDPLRRTVLLLSEIARSEPNSEAWNQARRELQSDREQEWRGFGMTIPDQIVVKHAESILDQSVLVSD